MDQEAELVGGGLGARGAAVMSFGGFVRIGESYNPVPWKSLTYDVNLGGYVMDTDRARLERRLPVKCAAELVGSRLYRWVDKYWAIRPGLIAN